MKIERHAKIIELINQYAIETQEELAGRLNEAGFRVTQATVSRDIRELKLTKMTVEGKQCYVVVPAERKVYRHSQGKFRFHGHGPEYPGR